MGLLLQSHGSNSQRSIQRHQIGTRCLDHIAQGSVQAVTNCNGESRGNAGGCESGRADRRSRPPQSSEVAFSRRSYRTIRDQGVGYTQHRLAPVRRSWTSAPVLAATVVPDWHPKPFTLADMERTGRCDADHLDYDVCCQRYRDHVRFALRDRQILRGSVNAGRRREAFT